MYKLYDIAEGIIKNGYISLKGELCFFLLLAEEIETNEMQYEG